MKGFGLVLATVAAVMIGLTAPASAYKADRATKIDVMGEWAHPDDDVSIIGPCGVWHERYDVRCGIIQVTRGEGGGNAVGTEIGPALGLRRENEDRVAHFRSGTVDLFFLDRVDFFYNTSAPLSQFFWGEDETLRRITRIIRMTQPEIYIGFTPSLAAGHGHHQQAGRYIWEGVKAAADPRMFPEQLRGRDALSTWQVKKVFSGGSTAGTGGTTTAPHCTTGFAPAATNTSTVAGVWTGYDSPYDWPRGQRPGAAGGNAEELGADPPGGDRGVSHAEPPDVQGHRGAQLPALRHDGLVRPVPAERSRRRRARRRDPVRRCRAGSGRAAARDDRAHLVLRLLQRARRAVPGDRAPSLRQGHAAGRLGRARRPRRAGRPSRRSASGRSRAGASGR